jgi:hypothetical protein
MYTTIAPLTAITFHRGRTQLTRFEVILILLFAGAVIFEGVCEHFIRKWIKHTHGRNWPTVSALIDIVSVTLAGGNGISSLAVHDRPYYLATLTYSYNNPEQQMGEYSRRFGSEDDAKAWANSYKGEIVKVHVDPRDPTRSVLREEDL